MSLSPLCAARLGGGGLCPFNIVRLVSFKSNVSISIEMLAISVKTIEMKEDKYLEC